MALLSYTRDAVIARPPEVVFDFLSDLRNELRWNPDAESIEKLTDGPVGVGTRFRALWSRTRPTEVELIRFERPHVWASRSRAMGMEVIATGEVVPVPRGSHYAIHLTLHPTGLAWLVAPVAKVMMERAEPRNMELVRHALETD